MVQRIRFFEAAHRRSFANFVLTTRRAIAPWKFWRWVTMEQRPNLAWMGPSVVMSLFAVALCTAAIGLSVITLLYLWDLAVGASPYSGVGFIGRYEYEIAMERAQFFLMPWAGRDRWSDEGLYVFMVIALMAQAGIAFTFVLLPTTLKRAKVIPSHLARIAAWSFVGLPMLPSILALGVIVVEAVDAASTYFRSPSPPPTAPSGTELFLDWVARHQFALNLGVVALWTVVWWGFALGRYLKLPRPWAIALAMFTISVLAATLVCLMVPEWRYAIAVRF
jgi:hypothetical protein